MPANHGLLNSICQPSPILSPSQREMNNTTCCGSGLQYSNACTIQYVAVQSLQYSNACHNTTCCGSELQYSNACTIHVCSSELQYSNACTIQYVVVQSYSTVMHAQYNMFVVQSYSTSNACTIQHVAVQSYSTVMHAQYNMLWFRATVQ